MASHPLESNSIALRNELAALAHQWNQLDQTMPAPQAFACWEAWVELLRKRHADAEIVQKLRPQVDDYLSKVKPHTPLALRESIAQLQHELATSLLALGRFREASNQFEGVLSLLDGAQSGSSHQRRQIAEACLAIIHESQGQLGSALKRLRSLQAAVDEQQKGLPRTPWNYSEDPASLHEITARVLIKLAEIEVVSRPQYLEEAGGHLKRLAGQSPEDHLRLDLLRARYHLLRQSTKDAEMILHRLWQVPDLSPSLKIQVLIELSNIALKREPPDCLLADLRLRQAFALLEDRYDPQMRVALLTQRILLMQEPAGFFASSPKRFNRLARRGVLRRPSTIKGDLIISLQSSLRDLESVRVQLTGDAFLADNVIERADFFGRFREAFEVLIRHEYDQIGLSPHAAQEHALRCLYYSEQAKSRQLLDRLLQRTASTEAASLFPQFDDWRKLFEEARHSEQILEYFAGRSHSYVIYYHAGECEVAQGSPHVDAQSLRANFARSEERAGLDLRQRLLPDELWERMLDLNRGGGQRLLIVPDGILHQIPLERAFDFNETKQMCTFDQVLDETVTAYAPSLTCLAALRRNQRPDQLDRLLTIAVDAHEQGDLHGTADACDRLHSFFQQGSRLHQAAAQVPAIQDLLNGCNSYSHVVIASHRDAQHGNAAVMLAGQEKLLASEIERTLHLTGNQLVWLSTCDSAAGKTIVGEGQDSLARAFLLAGAPRVMATFTSIENKTAQACTQNFFANLQKAMDNAGQVSGQATPWLNAKALKQTRLELLQDKRNTAKDVGAYILVGLP